MTLAIFITGGTFDKVHDPLTESLIFDPKRRSGAEHVLKTGRAAAPRLEVLMQVDSLEMTDTQRTQICAAVRDAPEKQIVITHGTGTMALTARALEAAALSKTVVLTGAMRPQALGKSDAAFNLGGAMIAAQTLPAGVYVVMNGQVFPADDVEKDTSAGVFVRSSTP